MSVEEQTAKSVGEILREARMAKGLTIEAVEAATAIRGMYLRNLENEEYDKTPGSFFVKGAIRTYGNFLGLDGVMLVDMYKAGITGASLRDVESKGIREAKNVTMKLQLKDKRDIGSGSGRFEMPSLSGFRFSWLHLLVVLLAVALIAILYFAVPAVLKWSGKMPVESPVMATAATAVAAKADASNNTPQATAVADKIVLELESAGECWLEVSGDGKVIGELMLRDGEKKTYEAKESLTVKYGNIGVIKMSVNGKPVDVSGEHGVAVKTYTRENIKK